MPVMENDSSLSATVTAFSAVFVGLCRALEQQKILTPKAVAQEIFLQRNMLQDDPESKKAKKLIETLAKKLEESTA